MPDLSLSTPSYHITIDHPLMQKARRRLEGGQRLEIHHGHRQAYWRSGGLVARQTTSYEWARRIRDVWDERYGDQIYEMGDDPDQEKARLVVHPSERLPEGKSPPRVVLHQSTYTSGELARLTNTHVNTWRKARRRDAIDYTQTAETHFVYRVTDRLIDYLSDELGFRVYVEEEALKALEEQHPDILTEEPEAAGPATIAAEAMLRTRANEGHARLRASDLAALLRVGEATLSRRVHASRELWGYPVREWAVMESGVVSYYRVPIEIVDQLGRKAPGVTVGDSVDMTQNDLADLLGVAPTTLRDYVRREQPLRGHVVHEWARINPESGRLIAYMVPVGVADELRAAQPQAA